MGNLYIEISKAILRESLFVECLVILSIGKKRYSLYNYNCVVFSHDFQKGDI